MTGKNAKFRLEQPLDTRTGTGGATRAWPNLPDFYGNLGQLSASEQELWERDGQDAAFKLTVSGRQIPAQHHDKVRFDSRVILLNRRNELPETTYVINGVKKHLQAGRIRLFEIMLGEIQ